MPPPVSDSHPSHLASFPSGSASLSSPHAELRHRLSLVVQADDANDDDYDDDAGTIPLFLDP